MQNNSLLRLVIAAGLVSPLAVSAQDLARLDPIVVTPTLSVRTVDESLSSVTVIDRKQLDRQQPRQLSDILRGQPGVDVTTNGAFGKNTSVFMRGTGSESTLLMLDGIRMGSVTSGGASWQFLPPQLLGRVEIVRGPRSSLYGSDAVGGVVQVFSPESEGDARPWFQFGGGSFSSREYGAGLSGSKDGTAYSFGHSYFQTDGIAVREGGEDKGYSNAAALGRLSHSFEQGTRAGLTVFRSEGNSEFDDGETDFVIQAIGTTLETPVSSNWLSTLSLSESRDEADSFQASFSRFDTKRHMASWQNAVFIGPHELVVGTDFRRDQVDGTTDYDESRRENTGVFGQLFLDAVPVDVQLSLRWDDNEAYGEQVTGAAAVGYALDGVHRLRASYGTAFRAPTFNDLYFPGFGNPDLNPERSSTAEVGISARRQHWFWDLAVYQTDVEDLILFVFPSPQNVDEARIRGAELSAGLSAGPWRAAGAATLTDPRDRATDKRLRRRSAQSLRLDIDRQLGRWSVGVTSVLQGDRYDDAANANRLPGFGLLNLRAGWAFAENWSAQLSLDNVLDKDYAVARFFGGDDFQQAGRSGFLSVRYGTR